jgi:hypothetical protein
MKVIEWQKSKESFDSLYSDLYSIYGVGINHLMSRLFIRIIFYHNK